jgi:redox-sensing transcriptional repressor
MFERRGVNRLAMFDVNPDIIGTRIYDVPVYSVSELGKFCKENNVHIGVITVPKEAAPEITDVIVEAGVKGIWNFANIEINLDRDDVIVENIHLGDSLMALCYEIKTANEKREEND